MSNLLVDTHVLSWALSELIARALLRGLTLVTDDATVRQYDVPTMPA